MPQCRGTRQRREEDEKKKEKKEEETKTKKNLPAESQVTISNFEFGLTVFGGGRAMDKREVRPSRSSAQGSNPSSSF